MKEAKSEQCPECKSKNLFNVGEVEDYADEKRYSGPKQSIYECRDCGELFVYESKKEQGFKSIKSRKKRKSLKFFLFFILIILFVFVFFWIDYEKIHPCQVLKEEVSRLARERMGSGDLSKLVAIQLEEMILHRSIDKLGPIDCVKRLITVRLGTVDEIDEMMKELRP